MRDVVVTQDEGHRQSNGAKRFAVEVANRGGDAVSGIHLMCGYNFRTVRPVDTDVIVEVGHGNCLLIDGGSIAPGGTVSFGYTSYVRYDMTLLATTYDGGSS
ncbi:TPD1 protein homolog 1A-like [Setaria viridis]|uniref:TPD1 protein homolog 1A-like n=1 Tax=Setaria viridis TaxID=4556 RepID=UPI001493BB44|nr:TPD1 protein homolog 1A-like [Setaria viridis]